MAPKERAADSASALDERLNRLWARLASVNGAYHVLPSSDQLMRPFYEEERKEVLITPQFNFYIWSLVHINYEQFCFADHDRDPGDQGEKARECTVLTLFFF